MWYTFRITGLFVKRSTGPHANEAGHRSGHRSGHRPQVRSQATGQATGHRSGYRPQATGHTGHKPQVRLQVTGHMTKNVVSVTKHYIRTVYMLTSNL